jgi:hypothetical protein
MMSESATDESNNTKKPFKSSPKFAPEPNIQSFEPSLFTISIPTKQQQQQQNEFVDVFNTHFITLIRILTLINWCI